MQWKKSAYSHDDKKDLVSIAFQALVNKYTKG